MSRTRLQIEGFDEFDATLAGAGDALTEPDIVVPVLVDALEPVAERAREIVPVRTGRLRDDIIASDSAADPEPDALAAYVGPSTDAFYAEDVEFGSPPSISRSGREWDAVPAKPYMRPAWDAEEGRVIDRLRDGLSRAWARALGR